MLFAVGHDLPLHDRWHHRRDGRLAAARLRLPGHLLRGRPHAQRAHRRDRVRGMFAGFYFWFPKATGRFLVGAAGPAPLLELDRRASASRSCPVPAGRRRHAATDRDYPQRPGWADLNLVSTAGAVLLAIGTAAVPGRGRCRRFAGPPTATDDPWGANSLEWATSSPPPRHNFERLPPIRSERPVFDARMAALGLAPDGRTPLSGTAGTAHARPEP